MLDFIREWIKHIVMIVVLAGFVEMILPASNIRKFVQLVVGLFLITAILNPILILLRQDVVWQIPSVKQDMVAWREGQEVIRQGQVVADVARKQALAQYRQQLEEQIITLALSVEGVTAARVSVLFEENPESQDFGRLKRIQLWVDQREREEAVSVVKQVEVRVGGGEGVTSTAGNASAPVPPALRQELVEVLTTFYNLEKEAVAIYGWDERE